MHDGEYFAVIRKSPGGFQVNYPHKTKENASRNFAESNIFAINKRENDSKREKKLCRVVPLDSQGWFREESASILSAGLILGLQNKFHLWSNCCAKSGLRFLLLLLCILILYDLFFILSARHNHKMLF